ncbi:MAG: right-handed parallel beta-helix repeat-containing protein, partial [Burkholderiales bacterium]|nr:right-handed parallel beta-helix repeat-containing protein [Burkholderiales bacterium]
VASTGVVGATGLDARHNVFLGTEAGVRIAVAASGVLRDNRIEGMTTGLDLRAAFTGSIADNEIIGSTGVRYDAAAALIGNTIRGTAVGVRSTIDGADALGFVAGSGVNRVTGAAVGVELVNARMQYQHVFANAVGVRGSGTLGGVSLDQANLIEDNDIGVQQFLGTIQYNRIAGNRIGIAATSGQKVWHNLIYRNEAIALQVQTVSDVRIYQNTFYAPAGDNIRIGGVSSHVDVRGNILWAEAGYDLYVANDSQAGFFSDYNNLYATGAGKVGYWTRDFVDVLDWQVDIARFDQHSVGATVVNPLWAQPRFIDIHADDFRVAPMVAGLRFTSPTVDAADAGLDQALPPGYVNLLTNAGFESGTAGWTVNVGGGTRAGAYEGGSTFFAGSVEEGFAEQAVDLLAAGYTRAQLDGGLFDAIFGGRLRSGSEATPDRGAVTIRFLDGAGQLIGESTTAALNATDRWELVGGRVTIPIGARFAVLRFVADREAGGTNDAWFDGAFLRIVSEAWAPDLGAYGFGTHEAGPEVKRSIALRFPDLYTDWEKNEPLPIRWETVNNTGFSAVRIDLVQDTPDGPKLLVNIVESTQDDGEYVWTPANSGIDFGTHGLRIQVSLVQAPAVIDRSQEPFSVPEDGREYWVDDGSNAGDEYTSSAVGSNRNTGKLASAPKPNPVNVLRAYRLDAGAILRIDAGDYPLIDPMTISGTFDLGLGLDEGFRVTGPLDATRIAQLFPAIAGNRTRALIELNDADFVTIEHLTLVDAHRGLYVHSGSESFAARHIRATGHAADGISIQSATPFADFSHLVATGNGAWGIAIAGPIRSLSHSVASGNANGIYVGGGVASITDNSTTGNGNFGLQIVNPGESVIRRNTSSGNRIGMNISNGSGIALIGDDDLAAANGNRVYGNIANGIEAGGSVRVVGNSAWGNGGAGIAAGGGAVIRSNVVWGNVTGIAVNGSLVELNRVYGNVGTGIDAVNATLLGNVIYSNATGVVLGGQSASTARNNLVYGNSVRGMLVTSAGNSQVINNTIHQVGGDALTITAAGGVQVFNNILSTGSGFALSVAADSFVGLRSDYNLFDVTGSAQVGLWQGIGRATLAEWRSASVNDGNSAAGDPLFVDPDGADGALGYVSLAVDGRDDDFHLRSAYGTFAGGSRVPVRDPVTGLPVAVGAVTPIAFDQHAPGIDRGRPTDDFGGEPSPNGGFINVGAYGGTDQASMSPTRYVTVLSPNGGERVAQNRSTEIRWRAAGFTGTVDIAYSGPGTNGSFVGLAAGEVNDGSFTWNVSAAGFAAGSYVIRIASSADASVVDTSDASFEV